MLLKQCKHYIWCSYLLISISKSCQTGLWTARSSNVPDEAWWGINWFIFKGKKQKLSNHVVYTGDSCTTQWRNTKKWETAVAGTAGIASFFTVKSQKKWLRSPCPDRSLMSEGEMICDIDLVINPNNHCDVDLLDFCLDQLDTGLTNDAPFANRFDLDEAAFEVMWILWPL